jgi:CBS domain-containing protein
MTRAVTTVGRELTIREMSDMFERDDFNSYPVLEDAQVVGIVTKLDLLKRSGPGEAALQPVMSDA